jgi:hypothetical protein
MDWIEKGREWIEGRTFQFVQKFVKSKQEYLYLFAYWKGTLRLVPKNLSIKGIKTEPHDLIQKIKYWKETFWLLQVYSMSNRSFAFLLDFFKIKQNIPNVINIRSKLSG